MSVASYTSELSYHEGVDSIRSFSALKKENVTPLPKKQLFILSVITLTEPMDMVFLFPFVYFMVQDFGVAKSDEVALYVGILSSSFPASQFLTSFLWGYLSDRWASPPMHFPLAFLCLTTSQVWTPTDLTDGCIWEHDRDDLLRLLYFLLDGADFPYHSRPDERNHGNNKEYCWYVNIFSTKVMARNSIWRIGEITDDTNRSGGFSIIGLVSGLGFILGPMIGGFLADPAGNHPELFGDIEFFQRFPYCLPCLATGGLSLFGAAVGFFFLDETLPSKKALSEDNTSVDESQVGSESTFSSPSESSQAVSALDTFRTLMKPIVIGSVLTYGIMSFATIMMDEVFAIWAVETPAHHGLEFTSSQVGVVLTFSGLILLGTQVLIYPPLARRLGPLGMYRLSILVSAPVFACFPTLTLVIENQQDAILDDGNAHDFHELVLWLLLLLLVSVRTFLAVTSFTSSIIMISNCVTPEYLGSVNGLGQMTASGFRALGPFMAGSLWTWSVANGLDFPFNHHFVFLIAAAICLVGFILALFLPSSVNTPKKRNVYLLEEEDDLLVGNHATDPNVNTSIQSYESLLMRDSKSI